MKRYSELVKIPTWAERLEYLKLDGAVGQETFGSSRYMNQSFYKSYEWQQLRRQIILRDCGFDLATKDVIIPGKIIIHHINPITEEDLIYITPRLVDPNNLVCVSMKTHNAIHFGNAQDLIRASTLVVRRPNDTCPWKS